MTENLRARLHAFVEGSVQGVGFRAFVVEEAQRLNLTGWVRNTWQGDVEVVAEGPRQALENLLGILRHGPRMSQVVNVRFDWSAATQEYEFFEVRRTL